MKTSGKLNTFLGIEFISCAAFKKIADEFIPIFDNFKKASWLKFDLELEIGKFVSAQLNGSWDIGPMLVLSGTAQQAYATTFRHYIELTWGVEGWSIVESIRSACESTGKTLLPFVPASYFGFSSHLRKVSKACFYFI